MALVFAAICVVDLATKFLAKQVGQVPPFITPGRNPDYALGLVSRNASAYLQIAMVTVATGLLVHSLFLARSAPRAWLVFPLIAGGATANAVDRIVTGAVHDWMNLGVAVANIADFALLGGLVYYVYLSWNHPRPEEKT